MADLLDTLSNDLKDAMRARDTARVSTIRLVLAALKNARIEAMHALDNAEETAVLRKQAKMRRDSIEQFGQARRDDLVAKEEAELAIIETYLPAALDAGQLRDAVRATIEATGASGPKDMAVVMRAVMARLGAQADGRQVQGIVREELAARGG